MNDFHKSVTNKHGLRRKYAFFTFIVDLLSFYMICECFVTKVAELFALTTQSKRNVNCYFYKRLNVFKWPSNAKALGRIGCYIFYVKTNVNRL